MRVKLNDYEGGAFIRIIREWMGLTQKEFAKVLGKGKYDQNQPINTEYDLLKAMFHFGKIRYLMGENFVWPYEDEFVARVNFAIKKKALIHHFYQINKFVEELSDD